MAINHIAERDGEQYVYLLADEYLLPDEARKIAIKLIELAHKIEHPVDESDWP